MYQAENARVLLDRENARAALRGTRVGRTVVLLGITSLFTDLSAEMVATVLPLYLLFGAPTVVACMTHAEGGPASSPVTRAA